MSRRKASGSRVTPKGTRPDDSRVRADRARRIAPARTETARSGRTQPEESTRYTPASASDVTVRPNWHRVVGWLGVAIGILIAILNDGMLIVEDVTLLPFGHSELYLLLGVLVAGWSTKFLGLFDRETVFV